MDVRIWLAVFRAALLWQPRAWRERYGREALEAFRDGLVGRRDGGGVAHSGGAAGVGAVARYAMAAVADLMASGWRTRREMRAERRYQRTRGGDGMLETFWSDLRYIGRRMLLAPAFTGMIVFILALGVGANAAVFSLLEEAVLAPVPFPDADGLVVARWTASVPGSPDTTYGQWSYPEFVDFREATAEAFQGLALYASRTAAVTEPGQAESVGFEFVTPAYFELLGIVPSAGRFFTPEEEGRDAAPGVVVISHSFWVQRFGGDPGAVGRTLVADGSRLQVVGVAPQGFTGLTGSARMWIPVGQARETFGLWILEARGSHWHHVLGRLRPGLTPSAAEERVAAAARAVDAVDSHLRQGQVAGVALPTVGQLWSNPDATQGIWLAMAAALVVLAITVANLASLLLARGRKELQETAVRLALGAPKLRLIRERLTEGLAVAALGGVVGLVGAAWMLNGLRSALPSHLFRGAGGDLQLVTSGAFGMDGSVALFGLGMALVAGALFSAAPAALQGTLDLVPALRRGGVGSRNPGRQDGNRLLVGAQVALSVVLLVGAGLFVGSLYRLHAQQEGFDADNLLILRYSLGGVQSTYETPEAAWEFHRTFRDRIRTLPGVRGAALGTTPPLSGSWSTTNVTGIVGRPPFAEGERPRIAAQFVGEDYFALLGIPTLEGATFQGGGGAGSQQDVVISRRAAETLFPGESALGRELEVGMRFGAGEQQPFRVIGVVDDVLYTSPASGVRAEMFVGLTPWTPVVMSLMVRTEGDPYEVLPEARRLLADLDPVVPFWQVTTGRELRAADVADTRVLVLLLGGFAGLALLLSTAGLWAVVARAAAERRREIGLRMALGARAVEVEALVFRQGLVPIVVGGVVGLVLAVAAAPYMDALLFGISPRSPVVFLGSAAVLTAGSLVATWLPARRAARVDPVEALAGE